MIGGTALVATGAAVILPAVAVGALNLLGFSAIGPVAGERDDFQANRSSWLTYKSVFDMRPTGSIAAGIQSTFYGGAVASGSAFALAQAAAMGGIAVGGAAEVMAGTFALTAGVAALAGAAGGEDDPDEAENY